MLLIDKQRTVFIAGPGIHQITSQPNSERLFKSIFVNTLTAIHPLQKRGCTDYVFDMRDGINMIVAESILLIGRIYPHYDFNLSAVTYEQGRMLLFPIVDMHNLTRCFYFYPHICSPESAEELIPNCSHLLYYSEETQEPLPELLLANEYGVSTTNLYKKREY